MRTISKFKLATLTFVAVLLLALAASSVFAQTNLALSATATTDSVAYGGIASHINDGINNPAGDTSWWHSGNAAGAWATLTWDTPQTFNKLVITERYDRATDFSINVDSEGSMVEVYRALRAGNSPDVGTVITIILPTAVETTSVQFYVNTATTLVGLYEIEVYNDPAATAGVFSGTVTDKNSGNALSGVKVSDSSGTSATVTDGNGNYKLVISPGTYDINFERAPYDMYTEAGKTVSAGETVTINAQLSMPASDNLALTATVSADSEAYGGVASHVNDGIVDIDNDNTWWCSANNAGAWIALTWQSDIEFSTLKITERNDAITDFSIQIFDSSIGDYKEIQRVGVNAQGLALADHVFDINLAQKYTTSSIKILVNDTTWNVAFYEIEVYNNSIVAGTLAGTVTDNTSSPLVGVKITLSDGSATITDDQGKYSIDVAAGTYDATAVKNLYNDNSITGITVNIGATTTKDFVMEEAGSNPDMAVYATATADSEAYGGVAGHINDGIIDITNDRTWWCSSKQGGAWIALEWPNDVTFSQVVITARNDIMSDFSIQIPDQTIGEYKDIQRIVRDVSELGSLGVPSKLYTVNFAQKITTNTLRVFVNSAIWGVAIYEIEVYDEAITAGRISGIVTDDSSNPLSDAKVTITGIAGSVTTMTGLDGSYAMDIDPDTYSMAVTKNNYKTGSAEGVTVTVEATITENFSLQSENVTPNPDLARSATASADEEAYGYVAANINDGIADVPADRTFWASSKKNGAWITLTWPADVEFNNIIITERYDVISDTSIQVFDSSLGDFTEVMRIQKNVSDLGSLGVPSNIFNVVLPQKCTTNQLKVYVNNSIWGVSMYEIEVYDVNYPTMTSSDGFVKKGWNLISLPAEPADGSPLTVLNGIDMSNASLQLWDNANDNGGGYMIYNQNWSGPMKVGDAYWLIESNNKTLSYQALANNSDAKLINIPAHSKVPYWIMVGFPFDKKIACENIQFSIDGTNFVPWTNAVQDTDKKWIEAAAQGFDAASQGYFNVSCVGSYTRNYLEPWFGYWMLVKTDQPLTISIPTSPIVQ